MPVEIKELIIRAVAEAEQEDSAPAPPVAGADTEAIVELCVKQVLRILKKSRER